LYTHHIHYACTGAIYIQGEVRRMAVIEKTLNAMNEALKEGVSIKRHYPLDEAAPLIGVTLGTLRQWAATGKIESLKVGRKRVIPSRVLEEIIEKGL
jgi:excisionase family DNA binding protein